jgi:hypothetical protein
MVRKFFRSPIKYLLPFLNISQGSEIFIKLYKIFIALCKYLKRPENILKEIIKETINIFVKLDKYSQSLGNI